MTTTFNNVLAFAQHNLLTLPLTFDSVVSTLDWIYHLFPADGDQQELYIKTENPHILKVKYIIYHSLIEIYFYHNQGLQSKIKHRQFVFNKVLHFKHLFSDTSLLYFSVTQNPIQFYSQFSNNMFNAVGI